MRLGDAPEYCVEALNVSTAGGWDATRAEVAAKGWDAYVEGEYAYHV
ncbi:hypothetical protein [Sphingomonas sp. CFBP 13720]|nr:hypothetical protein [Sphingomonas sp. CFBP 13720]MBD8679252.1 hypothetical protein [Sphingomonas sp. CFBP 13720]